MCHMTKLDISRNRTEFTLLKQSYFANIKVKWPRYRPGTAQRVGRVIALLVLDRGTRRRVVSSTPRPHLTTGKDPVPILQEAGWAPGPVWTGGKSRPYRDSIPDRTGHFANINLKMCSPSSFLHTSFELVFIILYFLKITETSTATLDTLLNTGNAERESCKLKNKSDKYLKNYILKRKLRWSEDWHEATEATLIKVHLELENPLHTQWDIFCKQVSIQWSRNILWIKDAQLIQKCFLLTFQFSARPVTNCTLVNFPTYTDWTQ